MRPLPPPLAQAHAFYILLETHGREAAHDAAKLDALLTAAMEDGSAQDGIIAQGSAQAARA